MPVKRSRSEVVVVQSKKKQTKRDLIKAKISEEIEEELDELADLPVTSKSHKKLPSKRSSLPIITKNRQSQIYIPYQQSFKTFSKSTTSVLVLGDGSAGQLGLGGDVDEVSRPKILNTSNLLKDDFVTDVIAGGMHSVLLTKKFKIITFGCNDEGALGRDGSESLPLVVEMPNNLIEPKMISCGDCHTAALTSLGEVYAWGSFRDESGLLRLKNDNMQSGPTLIYENTQDPVIKIVSGDNHLLMLTSSGSLLSIGSASQGQLGRLSCRTASRDQRKGPELLLKPHKVSMPLLRGSIVKVKDVFATSFSTFALTPDKCIYAWGLNNYNQIGISCDPSTNVIYFPLKISLDVVDIIHMCGGPHHTLLLNGKGQVYSMGRKEYGRLGLGSIDHDVVKPQLIPTLEKQACIDISAGENTSFAVTQSGEIYSWGASSSQLGSGDDEDNLEPKMMKGKALENYAGLCVSAGGQHTLILTTPRTKNT